VRSRAGALAALFFFALPAAPAPGAIDSFSWGFTRDGGPGGLALHVVDNETTTPGQAPPKVLRFSAAFPAGAKLSGNPVATGGFDCGIKGDQTLACETGTGSELTPGHSLDVAGFSVTPTMPDGGGKNVHFFVDHGTGSADPAGVGSGPPDPCPKNAAPSGPGAPHPGSSKDPLKRFVTQLYRDLLGRLATSGETKHFRSVLESGAATRAQAALAILGSPEYRGRLARTILKSFFHRGATPTEAASGRNQLGADSDEAYKAVLMGSAEYFAKCAHSDDTSFIQHGYRDVLGRDPTGQEISFWKSKAGGLREELPTGLLSSDEYFIRLTKRISKDLLDRNPTAGELAAAKKTLKSGGTDEQLKAQILGSPEYYFKRAGVTPLFENPKVNLAKHRVRVKILHGSTIFRIVVQKVTGHTTLNPASVEPTMLEIPNLKRVGIVNFGELARGDIRKNWDGTIKGKQLKPGNYVLVFEAVDKGGHLLYIVAPAALKVKEKGNR
jgi:hypothetical protein